MVLGRDYTQRWASREMDTKKTESRGCVGKTFFSQIFNPARRQVKLLEKLRALKARLGHNK